MIATTTFLPEASTTSLREGGSGRTVALWPEGAAKPTRDHPQLAMVLVPADAAATPGTAGDPAMAAPSWVFTFDRPAAPEKDGNQALAVNTTDGSVTYSVAFALVWAEDGEPVDTRNEAYAFASCSGCAAVAVGFQVVLIVGQTDVIVPENLSAAANYNCIDCLAYALASQLVLTLDGPLGGDSLAQLNALWAEIAEYGRNLQNLPLSEIQARLAAYKKQITAIVTADPAAPGTTGGSTTSSPTPAPGGSTALPSSPAPGGMTPAPATQPATGDSPPSYAPVETPLPTADTGGTAPAVEPQPTANPS